MKDKQSATYKELAHYLMSDFIDQMGRDDVEFWIDRVGINNPAMADSLSHLFYKVEEKKEAERDRIYTNLKKDLEAIIPKSYTVMEMFIEILRDNGIDTHY